MSDSMIHHALRSLLPPETVEYIDAHALNPHSPLQVLLGRASAWTSRAVSAAAPVVAPLADRALSAVADNQGAAGLVAALAVVTAVVVIMNWIRRLVAWWTRLVLRLAFWALVALALAVAWERGPTRTAADAVALASRVAGYCAALRDVWVREYNHYESQRVGAAGVRASPPHR